MKEKGKIFGFKIREFACFYLIAVIYLLIFSAYTSPLYPDFYSWDSPFFMLVGKMMNSGTELYSGIFDDKGPVIFLINACGYFIGERNGVFFIQTLFLLADICIMRKISELFTEKKSVIYLPIAASLIYLAFPLADGNTCEEYNIPFILISFYFLLSDLKKEKPEFCHSIIYGIGIAICAFTRVTNGVSIFVIVLFWIIYLIRAKRLKELSLNLLFGLAGILIIAIPVLLYFAVKGNLEEMIFDVFTINFSYASNSVYLNSWRNLSVLAHMIINFSPLLAGILVFFLKIKERDIKTAMILVTFLNIPVLMLGGGYNHYFAIVLPITLILFLISFDDLKIKTLSALVSIYIALLYFILAVRIIFVNSYDCYISNDYRNEFETVRDDCAKIPEAERNSILGYNMAPKYYMMGNIIPCFKYASFQDIWMNEIQEIGDEMRAYMDNTPPTWIIVEDDYHNEWLQGVVDEKYELKITDPYLKFYRLNAD